MQLKSKSLIAFSIFTLIALIGIQGYLIYNTYQLKKRTYTFDAGRAVGKAYYTKDIDSLMWIYRNDFLANLEKDGSSREGKIQLINELRKRAEEINPVFLKMISEGLAGQEEKFDVRLKKVVTLIELTDSISGTKEVIYPSQDLDTLMLLGENFKENNKQLIYNSTWQDDSGRYDLVFKSSVFMNIDGWDSVMFKELSGILILSSLLFVFVVGLLYYSIQNLMKHKRLAEIKTDFINNITHELKTPLSTLSLATNTLTSEHAKGNTEIVNGAIQIIDRQNTRLQKLIDQVLQSSLGYQQIQLSIEAFNVCTFMNELLDDYMLTIPSSEISFNRNIESTGIPIEGDKFYLGTAIINILNNAIKYGGNKLTVNYFIDQNESSHCITIQDNGIGIEPKYQKYIFEKFFRVNEKDTHNFKGLGLGLYYTKQIIRAHNGSISVESKTDEGSKFIIKIPLL
jgi:nitrogen-specific signal transduction histidine kinase